MCLKIHGYDTRQLPSGEGAVSKVGPSQQHWNDYDRLEDCRLDLRHRIPIGSAGHEGNLATYMDPMGSCNGSRFAVLDDVADDGAASPGRCT